MSAARADEFGTALNRARPWIRALGAVVDAARDLICGTGSKAELAEKLQAFDAATLEIEGPGR